MMTGLGRQQCALAAVIRAEMIIVELVDYFGLQHTQDYVLELL